MKAIPNDSRYIPLTQQKSCCVPTCIQMVMLKRNILLVAAEEIGYYLGLTVKPESKHLFYKVRTSDKKPKAGWGTRIYDPRYNPNIAFKKLGMPLSFKIKSISEFTGSNDIRDYLEQAEVNNNDVLMCFDHGTLVGDKSYQQGHVVVFDRIINGKIRYVDPAPDAPKWGTASFERMFNAMKEHEKSSGGFWELSVNK